MKSKDQSEMIDRYLQNRMTEEEKTLFENSIKDNPSLLDDIKIQKEFLDIAGDKDFQTILPHIEAQDKIYHEKHKGAHKSKNVFFQILMILAFLVAAYFIWRFIVGG